MSSLRLKLRAEAEIEVEGFGGIQCASSCRFLLKHADERKSCALFNRPITVDSGHMMRLSECLRSEQIVGQ